MPPGIQKTICLLIEGLDDSYYSRIWDGVSDEAKRCGCNLLCYEGGSLFKSCVNPYEHQANQIYHHIDVSKIDGVIMSGSIKDFISDTEFRLFLNRFDGVPVVTLTPALDEIPSVLLDNTTGINDLMDHLCKVHHYTKFVFIGAGEANADARKRLQGYKKFIADHRLESGDHRILHGDFTKQGGYRAANEFLDRGVMFDALVAVDDETAMGAISALRERGIRVPEDVAVTGFDGIDEGEFSAPTLTTVRQPFAEIGNRAVGILMAMMHGQNVPQRTVLSARLMVRQSCGCFFDFGNTTDNWPDLSKKPAPELNQCTISQRTKILCAALREQEYELLDVVGPKELDTVAELFFDEIEGKSQSVFLPALNRVVKSILLAGEEKFQKQTILKTIKKSLGGLGDDYLKAADNLLHDGYKLISDCAVRAQAHKRLVKEQDAALMSSVGLAISNSFDIPTLVRSVETQFVNMRVKDLCICLYENNDCSKATCLLQLSNGRKYEVLGRTVFNSRDLICHGFTTTDSVWQALVHPLYFKDQQIGFVLFKVGSCKTYVYHFLSQHLSGALQGALLMKKVQDQALALEVANRELRELRVQEKKYLDAIKRELELGRKIQESFLPDLLPAPRGWESCALFLPAREVSGDFYDAFEIEKGKVAYVIADVSGKDVGAALFMSLIRTLVRAFAGQSLQADVDPMTVIQFANQYITKHHHGKKTGFKYATIFFAVVNSLTGELTYINAGHNPPAVLGVDGGVKRWLETTGPAVGFAQNMQFDQKKITIGNGEILFMYTDGVTEAKNSVGEFFTEKRFADLLKNRFNCVAEAIERVKKTLDEHGLDTVPHDDVTILALRRKG